MLDVQAALTAAGVPSYRAAFRPMAGQENPPPVYCIWTQTKTPIWDHDDGFSAVRLRAFLHLLSASDPEETMAFIRDQMGVQGFRWVRETDPEYQDDAGLYEILSEWEGTRIGREV